MKKMLIDNTQPEETRVVILDGNKVEDIEFESSSKKQIKGNIFTAKVIRIEPSLQAAFVDYGGNRHGFLAFGEIHPDYYNISDETKAEVMAEVDEIIERKRRYQAERKAEQERRRLEREAKRAEYEAKRAAEAEALASETTSEAEETPAETTPSDTAEEVTTSCDCGCGSDCSCRKEDGQCHCKENGVCTCDCGCGPDCSCRKEDGQCHCKENGVCTCDTKCHCQDDMNDETSTITTKDTKESETSKQADFEVIEDKTSTDDNDNRETTTPVEVKEAEETEETEETELSEVTEAEKTEETSTEAPRTRKHGARFLGRRRSGNKKFKVSAETAGLNDNIAEDYVEDEETENESPLEQTEENYDDDEQTCRDFDNDDDEADFEHYLAIQRQLIFSRKLYHRSTIQDVIKEGQTLLIQVVKEERGNKGAACTTYISLAGRYCVLMPNRIKSGGVSRKITSATDRRRLRDIIKELPLNDNMSMIIRTAGEDKQREDIVRDYNYLIRTWNHIRHSALSTAAPALIYEEGDLIKRALRDMCTKDIEEVIIDGDLAYKTAKDFAKILSPNMSRKIKYHKNSDKPLFQQYQVEKELDKLHNPVVQLQSGGYLVINPTEALVSIDVNSGRATHEMDIEETALKTNLEAADEIAKQLKMRNLAGLVVVDFIDMNEPANNHAVEKRMKEAMRSDRARVQIAKMSIFGLLEISRQRMHSSFVESNYVTCPHCKGQGVIRTSESSAMLVLRAIEEEGIKGVNNHLEVKLPSDVAVYLLNFKRRPLAELEEKYNLEIIISADLSIKNIADYRIEKSRTTRNRPTAVAATSAYEQAEPANEDIDEITEDEQTSDYDETEAKSEYSNQKYQRHNKYGRRSRNNHRSHDYQSYKNNKAENTKETDTPSEQPAKEETKKTTWWKKLLG